jgi:hypothetical protein
VGVDESGFWGRKGLKSSYIKGLLSPTKEKLAVNLSSRNCSEWISTDRKPGSRPVTRLDNFQKNSINPFLAVFAYNSVCPQKLRYYN